MNRLHISHDADRQQIRTGDFLLCRGTETPMSAGIQRVTGSEYTHIAMAGWVTSSGDSSRPLLGVPARLMLGETIQQYAARLIDLGGEVRRWPGYYDVYRYRNTWTPYAAWNPLVAWEFMQDASGGCYGWRYITKVWARRRLGTWLIPPIKNSDDPQASRNCSGLCHAALRAAGGKAIKPYDCDVVPGDFAAEDVSDYIGTLFP